MYFEKLVQQHQDAVQAMLQNCMDDVAAMADMCKEAIERGNTIFLCGNGGSAADCQHIAAEFVGRFVKERQGLPAVAMTTDTSILTAVGNDYGFENIFRRQVEGLVRTGDVVIGISTSGNSKNIMNAAVVARALGIKVIGLTGAKGGELSQAADVCIKAPETETYMIQEYHLPIYHSLCLMLEDHFFGMK